MMRGAEEERQLPFVLRGDRGPALLEAAGSCVSQRTQGERQETPPALAMITRHCPHRVSFWETCPTYE